MGKFRSYRNFEKLEENAPLAISMYNFTILVCNLFLIISIFGFLIVVGIVIFSNIFYIKWKFQDIENIALVTIAFFTPIFFGVRFLKVIIIRRLSNMGELW